MKKILVPIDFSETSKYAADFAVDLAKKSKAEIVFLHSMHFNYYNEFPQGGAVGLTAVMDEVRKSVEERLDSFVAQYEKDIKATKVLSGLHLLEAVKENVVDQEVGLVVLGTEGSSGWEEFLIGSNTERIVRWVDCPVIAVPSKAKFDGIHKILVPIDLREIQDEFMKKLANLQKLFGAAVEFLWVKTPHNIENDERITEEFGALLKSYNFKNADLTITNSVFPMDGILEQASELKADMLAMATHARRGISHWFSGSITEDTVNHINIPVWTFKLDKNANNLELSSFKEAEGTPDYKKIEMIVL